MGKETAKGQSQGQGHVGDTARTVSRYAFGHEGIKAEIGGGKGRGCDDAEGRGEEDGWEQRMGQKGGGGGGATTGDELLVMLTKWESSSSSSTNQPHPHPTLPTDRQQQQQHIRPSQPLPPPLTAGDERGERGGRAGRQTHGERAERRAWERAAGQGREYCSESVVRAKLWAKGRDREKEGEKERERNNGGQREREGKKQEREEDSRSPGLALPRHSSSRRGKDGRTPSTAAGEGREGNAGDG
ncbi:hypothetical protein niasHS_006735 [Heterodera schachtii]|uniref:Uncharacterized protein n=1 Tax=Heterodera schachtii TaxID=97005 RepID=A0ABD2JI39_HETSC